MKKALFLSLVLLIFSLNLVSSYDNLVIHPALSEAAIQVFENHSGKNLSAEEKAWIVEGSIAEDTDPRYKNHYYDPTTGRGLDDYDTLFNVYQRFTGMPAKEWAKNQNSVSGDYSINKTLENYRQGNKKRAFQGIGHTLHLIQDMAVPAHTLNDSHAQGDPYEGWAELNGKINLSKTELIPVDNIDSAFDQLAIYSNNNFFSLDKINIDKLDNYEIIKDESSSKNKYYIVNNLNGVKYKLSVYDDGGLLIKFDIDDFKVHMDYWNMLHPKAVGYSAGVLNYFVKEFEKIDNEEGGKLGFWDSLKKSAGNFWENTSYVFGDTFLATRNNVFKDYSEIKSEIISYKEFADLYKESSGELIVGAGSKGWQLANLVWDKSSEAGKDLGIKVLSSFEEFGADAEASENKQALEKTAQESQTEEKIGIEYVIDGDTIVLTNGEKVRYIGFDAPELNKEGPDDDECLAWVARLRNMQLLGSGNLKLIKDPSADKDRYSRLLRYVYSGNVFLNDQLAKEGLGEAFFCQPGWENCPLTSDKSREDIILQSANFSKNNNLGIYSTVCREDKEELKNIVKEDDNNELIEKDPLPAYKDFIFLSGGDETAGEEENVEDNTEADEINTLIINFPLRFASSSSADFLFGSNFENVSFEYNLNNFGWAQSDESLHLDDLLEGENKIIIRAKNNELRDESPLEYVWIVDLTPPNSAISEIQENDDKLILSWAGDDSATASSSVSSLSYYDLEYNPNDFGWQELILKTASASLEILKENYPKICFRIRASDKAGNLADWNMDQNFCFYNSQFPYLKSVKIDSPDSLSNGYTGSPNVLVDYEIFGAENNLGYYISESSTTPELDDSAWMDFRPSEWLFSGGDGQKTIYAWLKIGDNLSNMASSSIILDTEAPQSPIINLYFQDGYYFVNQEIFSLEGEKLIGDDLIIFNGEEHAATSSETVWQLENVDLGFICTMAESDDRFACTNAYCSQLPDGCDNREDIYIRLATFIMSDMAGNVSEQYELKFTLDFTPPYIHSFNKYFSNPQNKVYFSVGALDPGNMVTVKSGLNSFYFQYSQNSGEWLDFDPLSQVVANGNVRLYRLEGEYGNEYNLRFRVDDNVGNMSIWSDEENPLNVSFSQSYPLISEVYGGGGNSGAYYKNDFIELYNPSDQDFSLDGWSVQYSAAESEVWRAIELSGNIKSYGYYLLKLSQGAGGEADLTEFDLESNINLSASAGKVALVNSIEPIFSSLDETVVDYVSYGKTNDAENRSGVFIGSVGNISSLERKSFVNSNNLLMEAGGEQEFGGNGWDTDNNSRDFIIRTMPEPQFSSSLIEIVYGW